MIIFLDQAVADFEDSHDFILTNSIEKPEMDKSFEEPDAVTSLGFLCSFRNILILLNGSLLLV